MIESWAPGDTSPAFTALRFYKEYSNPADTTIGSGFASLEPFDTTKLVYFYDGNAQAYVNWEEKTIPVDSFKTNVLPFRPIAPGHNLVRDVVSNILVDSTSIYIASKEKISRLNHDGLIDWTSSLPEDMTSTSSIFFKDSLIVMINKGYAYMGYRQLDFGKPFLAAFNINTGRQLYLSTLSEKKDRINGFKINNDTVLLVFNDKVLKYSLKDGSLLSEKSFDIESSGELRYFVGGQVYLKTDSTFNNLTELDSAGYNIFTKSGKTLVLNDKLDLVNQIDYNQVYLFYLKTKDYKFLVKDNETTIIDNTNKKVADMKISGKSILLGSILFDMQEKSFFTIDVTDLIN